MNIKTKTEGEHFEQLIEALSKVKWRAKFQIWDIDSLHEASKHAGALAFYRTDIQWDKIAVIIDELTKTRPLLTNYRNIVILLGQAIINAKKLMNKGVN